jgi:hypothetical protein
MCSQVDYQCFILLPIQPKKALCNVIASKINLLTMMIMCKCMI